MKIEIDQSIKIEDTARPTVVADSLGNGIWISSNDKKYLQNIFRKAGKKKMFIIQTFAALVSFLIARTANDTTVYVIDVEYDGLDQIIKTYILRYLRRLGSSLSSESIRFSRVGKRSKAHLYAYTFYTDKKKQTVIQRLDLKSALQLLA